MKKIILLSVIIITFSITSLISQNDSIIKPQTNNLKVYVNSTLSDWTYLRENIQFVDYVRIDQEADVYILSTSQQTGSGGAEHSFFFIGQNGFLGQNDTLQLITEIGETREIKRQKAIQLIKVGLMRYISKTNMANYISINYNAPKTTEMALPTEDKWDLWYFSLSSSANGNGEKSYQSLNIWSSFEANRITKDWKTEFEFSNNYSGSWYHINDSLTIESINLSYGFSHLLVKSLGEHWSAGESFSLSSSEYNNIKLSASIKPSLEFNIFPFSEATRRQLRFLYGIGAKQVYYYDTTIYFKTKEMLFEHTLKAGFEQIEPWGSVYFSARWANYLHNFKYNNLDFYTSINWRIFKGFSIRVSGGVGFIHNQLNLPKASATPEEILTRKRMLESQYNYWLSAGFSYSFGSIYNNIVNPRFNF